MRKLMKLGMIKYSGLAVLSVFISGTFAGKGNAQVDGHPPTYTYTCIGEVYYKLRYGNLPNEVDHGGAYLFGSLSHIPPLTASGVSSVGRQVSGPTITNDASQCHGKTSTEFVKNTAWSTPANVCGRLYNSSGHSGILEVVATDYFWELTASAGYNRVAYYKGRCCFGQFTPLETNNTLTVVPVPIPIP